MKRVGSALGVMFLLGAVTAADVRTDVTRMFGFPSRGHGGRSGRVAHDPARRLQADRGSRTKCQGARDSDAIPAIATYNLRSAPFPGSDHPDVAVHVPAGFDGTEDPGVVVFFHGWENCVANVLGSVDGACSPDGPVRDAMHLAEQLDAAHVNAILVAIEGRYDVQSGEPGQLLVPGNLRALLHELFVEHLNEPLGCELDVDDFEHVVLSSHSGGYQATSAALQFGGVPVREVQLFDSLYGEVLAFHQWIASNAPRFENGRGASLRFANVYTCCGGTSDNSRVMAGGIAEPLTSAGRDGALYADESTTAIAPSDLSKPIVFKLSELSHVDVPRTWFRTLVETSGFAPRP